MDLFKRNYLFDNTYFAKIVGGIVIQEAVIKVGDDEDMEFIEDLQNLGINRNVAKLIKYLKEVDQGSSRDTEITTGMKQPEVSITMSKLRDLVWISEHDIKTLGKGSL
jgi:predicted transcriptional regulator